MYYCHSVVPTSQSCGRDHISNVDYVFSEDALTFSLFFLASWLTSLSQRLITVCHFVIMGLSLLSSHNNKLFWASDFIVMFKAVSH